MLNMTMTTADGKQRHQVRDVAHASELYSAERDASGEGASTWGEATLTDEAGAFVARVSYNGKVWDTRKWAPDDVPVFDPYADDGSPDTPRGLCQPGEVHVYVAPSTVRTFDTFAVSDTDGGPGIVRVYAGNGTAADPHGAAFDFDGDKLVRFGARVTNDTMALIRACAAGAA